MRIVHKQGVLLPDGFLRVLGLSGHQLFLWKNEESSFDIFDKYDPDLIIISNYDNPKSLDKCLKEVGEENVPVYRTDVNEIAAFDSTISLSCLPCKDEPFDVVYFGEYDPILFGICNPDYNRSVKIFNSSINISTSEVGYLSLTDAYLRISNKTTLIHLDRCDKQFAYLAAAKSAIVLTNTEDVEFGHRFDNREQLMGLIEQESLCGVDGDFMLQHHTYWNRAYKMFKVLKMPDEANNVKEISNEYK